MTNLDHIIPDLRPLAVPLDDLKLDPANARVGHALDRIAASLHRYGQRKPIVVNRSEGNKIEAGNGTWQAAKSLGWTHIAAVFVEDDNMTATGYAIADNRLGDLSEWDAETLQALVDGLDPELNLPTGFDDGELADMLAELGAGLGDGGGGGGEPGDAEPQTNRAEELREKWQVQPGQLWRLPSRTPGQEHRLICGDCTDGDAVARVMGGERFALLITDPPYGVEHKNQNIPSLNAKRHGGIANDGRDGHEDFVQRFINSLPGGDYTCFIFGAYVQILVWYKLLEKWRKVNQILCWKKDNAVMSRLHFHMEFELIYHIYKYESEWNAPVGIGDVLYYPNVNSFGYMKDDGERNKNNDAQIHPHQKPLKLVQDLVMWGSGEAGKVYDPFSGSGTTTIAAENLARQCRACEISPAYVAVALERYFQAFNIKPELME